MEEVWSGDYVFENEWQSFRTKKNRKLELIATARFKKALDRAQDRGEEGTPACHDPRHVPAERFHQRDDDSAEQRDLEPAIESHGSEPFRAKERVDEIEKDERGHQ